MNFLISFVIGLVINLVVSLVTAALAPRPQQPKTGRRGTGQYSGPVPQFFIVGTSGEESDFQTYYGEWGDSDGAPNAYTVDQFAFGILPVDSLTGLYINRSAVTLSTSTSADQGYAVPEKNEDGEDHFWWQFERGDQVAANSYLISKFASRSEKPFTSAMIGRGVPLLTTTALWNENLWPAFPATLAELRGIRLYDPRKDGTAGGSGSQRWGNPSTWAWTDNPAVILYNIYRGIHYNAAGATTLGEWLWGYKRTAAQLPYAVWSAAMNKCDEPVALGGGGTERRYRVGRRIYIDERPADVVRDFSVCCNARISDSSTGEVYIVVDLPETADGSFHDTDILGDETSVATPLPSLNEVVNGASAVYRDPAEGWVEKPADPFYDSALEVEDDNNRFAEGVDLRSVFSGTQVQRILKAIVKDSRRFRRHVVALPARFAVFRPLQIIEWTSPRHGYVAKKFMITVKTRNIWGFVVLGLQEIDPSDFDWNPSTDERPINYAPVTPNRPPPQIVTGVWVEPYVGKDAEGKDRRPGYMVHWPSTAVQVDVSQVAIAHRLKGETSARWNGVVQRPALLVGSAVVLEALLPDEVFEVQVTYITNSGRRVVASDWLEVITPDIKLTSLDFDLDELAVEISESIADLSEHTWIGTRDVIEWLYELVDDDSSASAHAYLDRQKIRQELVSVSEASRAAWSLDLLTAVGPGSAIAVRIETLETSVFDPATGLIATNSIVDALSSSVDTIDGKLTAQNDAILALDSAVGDFSAEGILRVTTVANTSGAVATAALGVAASEGATMGQAAIYLRALSDGSSEAFVVASRFAVRSTPAGTDYGIFAVDAGVVWIDEARIRNLKAVNIAAGAVTADKLDVGTLSAISANMGSLTAGEILL